MDEVMGKDRGKIAHLFEGCQAALVWSCLQNCMGRAWADRLGYPEAAQIIVGDFCFFAGKANEALVKNIPVDFMSDEVLMVPQNESWEFLIRKIYGTAARGFARYAIKKEGDIFDRARLKRFVDKVSDPYCLKEIDRELYHKVLQHEWSKDFCALYKNYEDYRMHGLGYVALYRGEPVSGASAYGYYRSGIEIEVDTKTGYRRQGLAAACAARLILECLSRNIYPSWDAHSLQSAGLAQKLGYHADRPYDTYAVKKKKAAPLTVHQSNKKVIVFCRAAWQIAMLPCLYAIHDTLMNVFICVFHISKNDSAHSYGGTNGDHDSVQFSS